MGVHVVQGEGEVLVFSTFSQWEMPLDRRRWNVSDSYAKTRQHFHSANLPLESSIRGLFGDAFGFNINVGVYEKLAKSNDCSAKTRMQAATRAAITVAAAADRYLHIHDCTLRRSAAPPTARTARSDAARSQITLGTLVRFRTQAHGVVNTDCLE